jgi:PAS domain S-box-containing protein
MAKLENAPGSPADANSASLGEFGHALLEAMPAAAWVCDADGLIVACNAGARQWWGDALRTGSRAEQLLCPLLPSRADSVQESSAETPLAQVLRSRQPICGIEVGIALAPGGPRRARAAITPLTDSTGALWGVLGSFQPEESADDLEDLFENGAVGMHFVAPDGTILRANEAELDLLGYQRDEYIGHHIDEFHADPEVLSDIMQRLAAGQQLDKYPARLIARDGCIRHVQISSSGRFREGNFVHTRCFTVDVTEQKRLAEATQASERLAHQLLQALPAAIYTTDAHGRITFYNEAAVEFSGRRPAPGDEWNSVWKLFHLDGTPLPPGECPIAIAIREARPVHGEEVLAERPDGSRIAFAAYPTPLFDDEGIMTGVVNMLVDVTERKKIERALQKLNTSLEQRIAKRTRVAETAFMELHRSERNFELLVGAIVDYAIYMVDPQGNISNWNTGAERLMGYRAEEIVGRHFSCFYTPEDCARGMPNETLQVALAEGRHDMEGWRVRKDGSRFWASAVTDPIIDDGVLIGFAKITHDITERMESGVALVESERRARGVIDTALDGFVQLDEACLVVEWNPQAQAMFGWPRRDVLGQPLEALIIAPEDRSRFADSLPPRTRDTSRGGNRQIEAITRDGRKLPVELSISTLPLTRGHCFNVFLRDLSEKNSIEAQLRQSQKMEAVGQLTGGLAHDFNNLLQGIMGSLDLIQLRIESGRTTDLDRFINGALTSANHAAALTHRLLAFSRRQPLDPHAVSVNALVASMRDLIKRTMGEKVQLEFELDGNLWPALCDPNQLESAVLNLAINARDAMPGGGRLIIRARNIDLDEVRAAPRGMVGGPYVCIEVVDTGIGMPADGIERAFDPFFTTKPAGKGTGLGLSMVYGFARQSNGYCDIRSTPGEGTTVRLYLPRHQAVAGSGIEPVVAPTPVPTPVPTAARGEVVLVVEDETVVREVVVAVLQQLGYRALEATDGKTGLKMLHSSEPIELLVSDIGLPDINGRLLADAAREVRPGLKILLMTGYASEAAVAGGFLAPGMELITKPFTVEALAKRMRDMIEDTLSTTRQGTEDPR